MQIKITESAVKRVKELITKGDKTYIGLRVSVDGGGCSGFMYRYNLADMINSDDFILEQDGIKVVIDSVSQDFLDGCIVEYVMELGASYFQITNPKATAKCGCGNSFAV